MRAKILSLLAFFTVVVTLTYGQVTSSSITGSVRGEDNKGLEGATVVAVHQPSGTRYSTVTGRDGLYTILSVRVGGPYLVTVTYAGYKKYEEQDVYASLGNAANVEVVMKSDAVQLQSVVIKGVQNPIINSKANGASITLGRQVINATPTIGRTVNDIVKYNAYGNGRSFAAQDSRFNNFTIDGSVFNNGFGLGSQAQAGGRTGSTAISLDALEEVQVNITPYDIKQSGFVGANLNAVTRSGTNEITGSAFRFWSNRDLAGSKANSAVDNVPKVPFNSATNGFRIGGPIIKNKLFFFINGEFVKSERPALDWVANKPGATGNVSRTTEADLLDLKSYMLNKFKWDMGAIDNFNNISSSNKFLARIDYNISDKHKLTVRYSHHDSQSDAVISNSNSSNTAGNGNRQGIGTTSNALSGQNTGYIILDNTRSIVAELNSNLKKNLTNQFLVTFNKQIEDRKYRTDMFPTIDILKDGNTYTSIGFDPFTPDNKLNYQTFNVTNNTTFIKGKHNITVGASFEAFKSNNLFFYASNGVWVFNSIADFKTAADAYLANNNLTTSPVPIARFNYRYTLLPDGQKPWQTFKNNILSAYIQDEYRASKNFRMNYGIRFDYLAIPNTATDYSNEYVNGLTFFKPDGNSLQIDMGSMPGSRLYVSPRFGFNWDVKGNKKTQIRGGTGLFLSRMPYVLLSNQLGNNGVNIGLINVTSTTGSSAYPFTLNPSRYTPSSTNVNALRGYNLNYGEQDLKFPMNWKTNIAIDQKLFGGVIGTLELIYNKNLYALHYIDANLKGPSRADYLGRNYFPALGLTSGVNTARFHNPGIGNAFVLTNNNVGHSFTFTSKLEKPITRNWGGMFGYTYGRAYDLSSVGSTVNANTPSVYGQNYLTRGFSDNDLRHRFIGFVSYKLNYGKSAGGGTTISLGMVSASGGKISYTTSTDMNGDGQNFNDLIYVPHSYATTNFLARTVTVAGKSYPFTAAQQAAAFQEYINNHPYLSTRRGQYAERNGGQFPWLTRFDFSAEQDLFVRTGGKSGKMNIIRLRLDIINASNLVNNKWGVGYVSTGNSPLIFNSVDANGNPTFQLATQNAPDGSPILLKDAFLKSKTLDDVYQIQFGIRYIFNN